MSSPEDNRRRHSKLTGPQVSHILKALGVSQGKLVRDTGLGKMTIRRMLEEKNEDDIPLWMDMVLLLYIIDEEARVTKADIKLPLEDYGIVLSPP